MPSPYRRLELTSKRPIYRRNVGINLKNSVGSMFFIPLLPYDHRHIPYSGSSGHAEVTAESDRKVRKNLY